MNTSLEAIREVTCKFQEEVTAKRIESNPQQSLSPVHAVYLEGDFVLYDSLYSKDRRRPVKLANRATGPYSVIAQTKNDVTCRHMCTGVVHVFPVDRLSLFTGNEEQAKRLALEDADQDVIEHIDGWRGDPAFRTTLEFFVKFRTNEDYIWLPWNDDFAESLPYEQYCNRYPCLRPLLMTTEELRVYQRNINALPITTMQPGDEVYVSLR